MTSLTGKDIAALFGDLDDVVVADIIATGATAEELAEAHAWLANDEPLLNAGRPLPGAALPASSTFSPSSARKKRPTSPHFEAEASFVRQDLDCGRRQTPTQRMKSPP